MEGFAGMMECLTERDREECVDDDSPTTDDLAAYIVEMGGLFSSGGLYVHTWDLVVGGLRRRGTDRSRPARI